jgi:sortase A
MIPVRPTSGFLVALAVGILLVGLWQVGQGSWIYTKAWLAQLLLQRAWARTLAGETAVKPWPWADTWPVARLIVPSAKVDVVVLNGAYGRTLAFGPGYVESSVFPGSTGTTILTGHRDTHFRFLENVQNGQDVLIQTAKGAARRYRIQEMRIADARTESIGIRAEQDQLVMVTCYPFDAIVPGGPLRYVVTAIGVAGETGIDGVPHLTAGSPSPSPQR